MTVETDAGDARIIDVIAAPAMPSNMRLLLVIRRHWRLIGGIAFAGTLAALLLCKMLTPLYASRVTVLIDPRAPQRTATSIDPLSFLPPSDPSIEVSLVISVWVGTMIVKGPVPAQLKVMLPKVARAGPSPAALLKLAL